jgi:hypothetical protein
MSLLLPTMNRASYAGGGGGSSATWDAGTTHADLSLSNGDLTATASQFNAWRSLLANVSKTSGKWYWEITGASGLYSCIGVAVAGIDLGQIVGYTLVSASYSSHNYWTTGPSGYTSGTTGGWNNTKTVGCALDLDNNVFKIYVDGTLITPTLDISSRGTSAMLPAASLFTTNNTLTANFGASPFAQTPPAGFNPGIG